jgi:dihydrolipoamide dehydrogenase
MSEHFDVVVIGAGPAGYVAAIRAAQLGLKTACVDNFKGADGKAALGGTCLNVGCIPSKALLDSSKQFHNLTHTFSDHGISALKPYDRRRDHDRRKDKIVKQFTGGIATLFKANKVTPYFGTGRLLKDRQVEITAPDGGKSTISGTNVILAAGSVPIELKGMAFDGKAHRGQRGRARVRQGAQALRRDRRRRDRARARQRVAQARRRGHGAGGAAGIPGGRRRGRGQGGGAGIQEARTRHPARREGDRRQVVKDEVQVSYTDGKGDQTITVDKLLVAVGRRAATQGLLADGTGVRLDERGRVDVDEHCWTGVEGVWAVGDCVRGAMLAHKGSEEGIAVAEIIAGKPGHVNLDTVPWVIYTEPEIAWVGKTEAELKAAGIPYKTGSFPFAAIGRAVAMNEPAGMVKVIAHAETDRLLGVHLVGACVSELVAEAVVAMEFHGSAEDLARICHAHPTLSEAVHEAALAVDKRAIHKAN